MRGANVVMMAAVAVVVLVLVLHLIVWMALARPHVSQAVMALNAAMMVAVAAAVPVQGPPLTVLKVFAKQNPSVRLIAVV